MLKKKIVLYISIGILFILGVSTIVLYKIGDRILEEVIRAEIGDWGIAELSDEILDVPHDGKDLADSKDMEGSPKTTDSANHPDISEKADTGETNIPHTSKPKTQIPKEEKTPKQEAPMPDDSIPEPATPEVPEPEDAAPQTEAPEIPEPEDTTLKPQPQIHTEEEPEVEKQPEGENTKSDKEKNAISAKKIKEVKDSVETADKMKAASLVLKRLSASDINMLIKMAEGGLSQKDKKKAIELVYDKFTEDEVKEIKAMYAKYMK